MREMFELAKDDAFKLQTAAREDGSNNLDLQLPYMFGSNEREANAKKSDGETKAPVSLENESCYS